MHGAKFPARMLSIAHQVTPAWRALFSNAAMKLAMALHAHARSPGSLAYPSVRRLEEITGLERRHIQRTLIEMANEGKTERERSIIIEERGGGRSRANQYRLLWIEQAEDQTGARDAPFSGTETADMRPPFAGTETAPAVPPFEGPETAGTAEQNGGSAARKRRSSQPKRADVSAPEHSEQASEQSEQQQSHVRIAAAAGVEDGRERNEVRTALLQAGVGEPVRSELAARSGLTPRKVRELAARVRDRGKETGVLVNELRTAADQAEASVAHPLRSVDPAEARLAQLTPAERQSIEEKVLNKLTPGSRNALQRLAPEKREHRVRELALAHLRPKPPTKPPSGAQPPDT